MYYCGVQTMLDMDICEFIRKHLFGATEVVELTISVVSVTLQVFVLSGNKLLGLHKGWRSRCVWGMLI